MRIAAVIVSFVLFGTVPAAAQYALDVADPPGGAVVVDTNFDLAVLLDSSVGSDIQGWSYGVCQDNGHVDFIGADPGSTTATVNNGSAPGFINLNVSLAGGYSIGVVINLFGAAVLAPGSGYELTVGHYYANGQTTPGFPTTIDLCSTLGSPPVAIVVVVGGASIPPTVEGATFEIVEPPPAVDFVRADANADGFVDIADGIWVLNDLFQGGLHTDCDGANDSNADGGYDAADAIYTFNYQFLGGPQPSAPFPGCGTDASPDPADCAVFPGCP